MGMIRIALALAVLLTHLPGKPIKVMSGGLAVQCFFIISGFYMSLVLEGKYHDRALFYTNRLLRLLPMYYVVVVLSAIALFGFSMTGTTTPERLAQMYARPGTALVLGFENLAVVGQELLYFFRFGPGGLTFHGQSVLPEDEPSVMMAWEGLLVPQAWSLSIEIMFYLLAPFLVRLRSKQLVVLALASIAVRLNGRYLPVRATLWASHVFPSTLFLFVAGMLAQRLLPHAARAPFWLRALAAPLVVALVIFLPDLKIAPDAARWLAYLVIAIATPLVFSAFKSNRIDRWIGDLSYPVYLVHLLVAAVVIDDGFPYAPWTAIVGSVALAAALLILIDRPVDRLRQARVKRRAAMSSDAAVAGSECLDSKAG